MKMKALFKSLVFITACLAGTSIFPCTVIFRDKNDFPVFARTFDLNLPDHPLLLVNPRGLERKGAPGANALTWTSKYGNVITSVFGTAYGSDGINEKGLAAHALYMGKTQYPSVNATQPQLSNIIWSQYYLDNFKTIDEALKASNNFQIVSTALEGQHWPIRIALEDSTGDTAVLEFVDGKLHIYHGREYGVVTNEPAYGEELAALKQYKAFGGTKSLPGDINSLDRFIRASAFTKSLPTPETNQQALNQINAAIRTVMVPAGAKDTTGREPGDAWTTHWVTLGDLANKRYYFSSTKKPNTIWLDLNQLNFNTDQPVKAVNLEQNLSGNVIAELKPYQATTPIFSAKASQQ